MVIRTTKFVLRLSAFWPLFISSTECPGRVLSFAWPPQNSVRDTCLQFVDVLIYSYLSTEWPCPMLSPECRRSDLLVLVYRATISNSVEVLTQYVSSDWHRSSKVGYSRNKWHWSSGVSRERREGRQISLLKFGLFPAIVDYLIHNIINFLSIYILQNRKGSYPWTLMGEKKNLKKKYNFTDIFVRQKYTSWPRTFI